MGDQWQSAIYHTDMAFPTNGVFPTVFLMRGALKAKFMRHIGQAIDEVSKKERPFSKRLRCV